MAIGVNGRVGAMQNNIMTCRKIAGRSKSAAVDGHIARTQRSGCTGTYNRMINDKAAAEAVVAIQCQSHTDDIHANGSADGRSEEHPHELQSLMSTSYDAVCLKKKIN